MIEIIYKDLFKKTIKKNDIVRRIDQEFIIGHNQKIDWEAYEIYCRIFNINNSLRKKIESTIFILESDRKSYSIFIREKNQRIIGFLNIFMAFLRTIYKFTKGYILYRNFND